MIRVWGLIANCKDSASKPAHVRSNSQPQHLLCCVLPIQVPPLTDCAPGAVDAKQFYQTTMFICVVIFQCYYMKFPQTE